MGKGTCLPPEQGRQLAAWAKITLLCPGATASGEGVLICMTLAVVCDWGMYYGLSPTLELELWSFLNHLLNLGLQAPDSCSLSSLLGFPLCKLGRTTLSFSCAVYGFWISIASFSGDTLSFCTSVSSAWYNNTVTSGEEEKGRIQGYLSLLQWYK